jgi:hypothetical protein
MSPYRVDARMSGRHPFEIYVLILCFLTALPILFGAPAVPGSIRDSLPPPVAFGWGLALLAGAALALFGIYFGERATGLICEQLGLALVAVACLIYAGCIIAYQGWDGMIAVGIVGGFGASCGRRYFQIQKVLDEVAAEEKRRRELP